jgi:hypothetical protein
MDPQKKEYLEKEKEEKKVENPFGDAFAMEFGVSDDAFSKVAGKVVLLIASES